MHFFQSLLELSSLFFHPQELVVQLLNLTVVLLPFHCVVSVSQLLQLGLLQDYLVSLALELHGHLLGLQINFVGSVCLLLDLLSEALSEEGVFLLEHFDLLLGHVRHSRGCNVLVLHLMELYLLLGVFFNLFTHSLFLLQSLGLLCLSARVLVLELSFSLLGLLARSLNVSVELNQVGDSFLGTRL